MAAHDASKVVRVSVTTVPSFLKQIGLITPYIRPICFKNDGTVVTLTRTTFDASCAAMVPQFLYAHSGLVFRQFLKLRARVAQAGAATRAGRVHRSGSVGRLMCSTIVRTAWRYFVH